MRLLKASSGMKNMDKVESASNKRGELAGADPWGLGRVVKQSFQDNLMARMLPKIDMGGGLGFTGRPVYEFDNTMITYYIKKKYHDFKLIKMTPEGFLKILEAHNTNRAMKDSHGMRYNASLSFFLETALFIREIKYDEETENATSTIHPVVLTTVSEDASSIGFVAVTSASSRYNSSHPRDSSTHIVWETLNPYKQEEKTYTNYHDENFYLIVPSSSLHEASEKEGHVKKYSNHRAGLLEKLATLVFWGKKTEPEAREFINPAGVFNLRLYFDGAQD